MLPPVVSATLIATALAAASNVLAQQVEHRDNEEACVIRIWKIEDERAYL